MELRAPIYYVSVVSHDDGSIINFARKSVIGTILFGLLLLPVITGQPLSRTLTTLAPRENDDPTVSLRGFNLDVKFRIVVSVTLLFWLSEYANTANTTNSYYNRPAVMVRK